MSRLRIATLALVLVAGCGGGGTTPVESARLANGLTVLLKPLSGTEQVALVVLYSVGGHHDPAGRSGMAHLLEHCYVTAAAGDAPARDMQGYVARYPDGWNAQTGDTYTVFATVFPRKRLDEELEDAAARMADLRLTQADLAREAPRIRLELANMYGGMPRLAVQNLARERVCPTPQGGVKGGLADEIAAVHPADLASRWARYYKPRNAVVVLAGAVGDADTAQEKVAEHFGGIPPGEAVPMPAAAPQPTLPSSATVRVAARSPGAGPAACLAWRAPPPDSPHYAAFLVLAARLARAAPELSANPQVFPVQYRPLDDPSVLHVTAGLRAGETGEAAVARIEAFVTRTIGLPMSQADIRGAKSSFGFMLDLVDLPDRTLAYNVYGAAFGLARRHQLGIDGAELRRRIAGLTETDLRAAAETVFAPGRRAAVVVVPDRGGR